jgi:hypothetical protein
VTKGFFQKAPDSGSGPRAVFQQSNQSVRVENISPRTGASASRRHRLSRSR